MRIKKWLFLSIVFALLFIFTVFLQAQEFGDIEELTLEIATETKEIIPMEPLPYAITLSNNTGKPIKCHTQIDPGFGMLKVYIAENRQSFEQFRSSDHVLIAGMREEVVLEPGFHKSVSGYFFYAHPRNLDKENRGQYLFEIPGDYRIKATFEDFDGRTIESNILPIKVKEPNERDVAAYQFIKDMQDDKNKEVYYGNFLLLNSASEKSEIQNKQEEFIKKFPDSEYSHFLYYSIGTRCISEKGKETKRGIDYLEKAANYKDFLFAEDSILKLIKTFTETGQTDKAREYKEMLAKRFPNSSEGRQYIEELVIASQEHVPQTKQIPAKKHIGIVLPVAVVVVCGIVIGGFILFLRKKTPNKAE